jgi:hypothetical protein
MRRAVMLTALQVGRACGRRAMARQLRSGPNLDWRGDQTRDDARMRCAVAVGSGSVSQRPSWWISGTYLESCNCLAICPCRRVGGRTGGRSTYGVCEGALSWAVEREHAGDVDLGGLAAVLTLRYDDDEPGSPWDFLLYLDERGDEHQRAALQAILTGSWGGATLAQFPWRSSRVGSWVCGRSQSRCSTTRAGAGFPPASMSTCGWATRLGARRR